MMINRIIILFLICAITPIACAQDATWKNIVTPREILVDQNIKEVPSNWQAYIPKSVHYLVDIAVYDGHPNKLASLEPDSENYNKNTKQGYSLYKLSPVMKDGIWISCGYYLTNVQICMKLPDFAKELRIYFDKSIPNNTKIYKIEYR